MKMSLRNKLAILAVILLGWVINKSEKAVSSFIDKNFTAEAVEENEVAKIEIPTAAEELVEDPPCVIADRAIKTYSAFTEWLKKCENSKLALGLITVSERHKDKLTKKVKGEVGYGTTEGEIADAISVGILPKGSTTPKVLTKEEADRWMDTVTIPTYKKIVEQEVKVPLTTKQKIALISFCQNLGRDGLKSLVNGEGRLNSGNYTDVPELMKIYCHVKGHKKAIPGLVLRRNEEARKFAEGTAEATKKEQLVALAR